MLGLSQDIDPSMITKSLSMGERKKTKRGKKNKNNIAPEVLDGATLSIEKKDEDKEEKKENRKLARVAKKAAKKAAREA